MKKSIFMLVTIALILTGCGHNADGLDNMPDSSEDTEVSATETGKYSNKINHLTEDLGNNVRVDADIEIPDNYTDAISDYKAQSCDFNKELVFNAFGIEKDHTANPAPGLYQAEGKANVEISEGISGGLNYHTNEGTWIQEYDPDYAKSFSDISNLGEGKALDFMTPDEAKQCVISTLEKLHIENAYITHIYALPLEYQKRIEQYNISNGILNQADAIGDRWDDLGDCYELKLAENINGIPLRGSGYIASDESAYNGSEMTAFVSKKGIVSFIIPNQYVVGDAIASSSEQILAPEDILNHLKQKLDSIVVTEPYTVTNLKLEYFPKIINITDNEFHLIPIWEVEMTADDQEKSTMNYLFDARTGLELEL